MCKLRLKNGDDGGNRDKDDVRNIRSSFSLAEDDIFEFDFCKYGT